jgi:hypothetical protein
MNVTMPLYTFVLAYRGGCYISQVRASSPAVAQRAWAKQLPGANVIGLGVKGKEHLTRDLMARENEPVPVPDMHKTWCSMSALRNGLALIHIVETTD